MNLMEPVCRAKWFAMVTFSVEEAMTSPGATKVSHSLAQVAFIYYDISLFIFVQELPVTSNPGSASPVSVCLRYVSHTRCNPFLFIKNMLFFC